VKIKGVLKIKNHKACAVLFFYFFILFRMGIYPTVREMSTNFFRLYIFYFSNIRFYNVATLDLMKILQK